MQLPKYTKRDFQILAVCMPLIVLLINSFLFGRRYFTEPSVFFLSGFIVLVVMTITWFVFVWIAVTVRNRLPDNRDILKRLVITIALISTIQVLVMFLFFQGYHQLNLFGYELNKTRFYWALGTAVLLNILITMLHEGLERFEKWKFTITETEKLKTAYAQSQLLCLKSQVNPHFLFNSLNSLSSLISEDSEKAERFLNELTKVYRYLLRTHDERLVTLETELQFLRSYYYLLKARYGECVDLEIEIEEALYSKYVSPLLMQTIFEYSFNNNKLVKECPLRFRVSTDAKGRLQVTNNLLAKQTAVSVSTDGIRSLVDKYKLLCADHVEINNSDSVFTASIPLIEGNSNYTV